MPVRAQGSFHDAFSSDFGLFLLGTLCSINYSKGNDTFVSVADATLFLKKHVFSISKVEKIPCGISSTCFFLLDEQNVFCLNKYIRYYSNFVRIRIFGKILI